MNFLMRIQQQNNIFFMCRDFLLLFLCRQQISIVLLSPHYFIHFLMNVIYKQLFHNIYNHLVNQTFDNTQIHMAAAVVHVKLPIRTKRNERTKYTINQSHKRQRNNDNNDESKNALFYFSLFFESKLHVYCTAPYHRIPLGCRQR